MKELTETIVALCGQIIADSEKETKAAHQRIRKNLTALSKVGKEYRKASVEADKAK